MTQKETWKRGKGYGFVRKGHENAVFVTIIILTTVIFFFQM